MGRLTKCEGKRISCNVSYCPEDCNTCEMYKDICDKLAHYEDLEEQGRLIELPNYESKELLINIVVNEVNVCPVDMGFEQEGNCNDGCYACWKKYL